MSENVETKWSSQLF